MPEKMPTVSTIDKVTKPIRLPKPRPVNHSYATHSGVLVLGTKYFQCYVLNTGGRVFDTDSLRQASGNYFEVALT